MDRIMGLFSRKQKINVNEFCKNFYDQWIFSNNMGGLDPWNACCETVYKKIADIDSRFSQADFSIFCDELRAVRIEVFAIALSHRIGEKLILKQSEFTKLYLEELQDGNIWQTLLGYNQAISRAVVGGAAGVREERAKIAFWNTMRANLFDEWIKLGHNEEAVARVANRVGSTKSWWKSGRGYVYLAFELSRNA